MGGRWRTDEQIISINNRVEELVKSQGIQVKDAFMRLGFTKTEGMNMRKRIKIIKKEAK